MKRMALIALVMLVLSLFVGVVAAAPQSQQEEEVEQVYVVKPGDGLILLAREFYGDGDSFLLIMAATNARAEEDSSFVPISDPNIIFMGQKLIIPGLSTLPADATAEPEAPDGEEEMETTPAADDEVEMDMTDDTPIDGPSSLAATSPLTGTRWILNTMDGNRAVNGTTISLDFIDGTTATGSSGCNSYNTTYEAAGIRIAFGPTAGTLAACTPPIMVQEQSYLQVLADAAFYQVTDAGMLRLFNSDLTMLADFEPASSELAGTSWDVISYNNGNEAVVSVQLDTAITAVFSEDGQISGSAGCNDYNGPYTTDGDAIAIGPLAATLKLCAEEGVMEQEAAYLAALETAVTFQISGDTMVMRTDEGAMVANFALSQE